VGANYGTHSILFLSTGIPTIAFEPNSSCLPHFKAICELNDLAGRWEQVAIGGEAGELELVFPESETWLGSVSPRVVDRLKASGDFRSQRVPVRTLDSYLDVVRDRRALIKIDVEGFEIDVLRGGSRLLRECRPWIVFESNTVELRGEIADLLSSHDYAIFAMPWSPSAEHLPLGAEFWSDGSTNFIAVPN
jgi:FkbM family methyltransferase